MMLERLRSLTGRIRASRWFVPLALLVVALLAYGLILFISGVFGDDPGILYATYRFGPQGQHDYWGWFRPHSAWFYILLTELAGEFIPAYHLISLALRWACAWALYALVRAVWKGSGDHAFWVAAASLVYPGFVQQPIALEFSIHFFVLLCYLLSMLLTARSLAEQRFARAAGSTAAALVLMFSMFTMEYFIGLELLRPLMIWALIARKEQGFARRLALSLRAWAPYALFFAFYAYWRLFLLESSYYQPVLLAQLVDAPLETLGKLAARIPADLWLAFGQAWAQAAWLSTRGLSGLSALATGGVAAALLIFFTALPRHEAESVRERSLRALALLLAGLLVMLCGGLAVWLSNVELTLTYPWDRTTLVFFTGASLALVGLLHLVPTGWRQALLALIVGACVSFQVQNNVAYLRQWELLRSFYWQLSWRAPALQPGTLVLTDHLPFSFYPDNALTPLLNRIYDPDNRTPQVQYKLFEVSARLGEALPGLQPGLPVQHRGFNGSTSDAVVAFKTPTGCLRLLSQQDSNYPDAPETLEQAAALSRLERAAADASPPNMPAFLGQEPAHDWCYYLQKAELAASQGRWDETLRLYAATQAMHFRPNVPFEWAVFIRANALAGNWGEVNALFERLADSSQDTNRAICRLLDDLTARMPASTDRLAAYRPAHNCP